MADVPREFFVPTRFRDASYEDIALPIGLDQTISQPYIVALMTQALELTGKEKVLEVGTGTGYQAAILSRLARTVVSVERLPLLAENARQRLEELDFWNVEVKLCGAQLGWPDAAPFDAIMVTAGAPSVPPDLLAQLAFGGRLVIPVGTRYLQELVKVSRRVDENNIENLGACRFVPLIGRGAWDQDS